MHTQRRTRLRRFAALVAMLLCLSGAGLTGLNLAGLVIPPAEHSRTHTAKTLKLTLEFTPPENTIAALEALPAPLTAATLREATRIVAAGIVHYWPDTDAFDPETIYSPLENWVIYIASIAETLAWEAGLPLRPRFSVLERFDYRAAIRKGVGFCSQVSLALADYLEERGTPSRVVGLDGHVVVETSVGGQHYLLDPDYDVIMPLSLDEAARNLSAVEKYYLDRGYPSAIAARIAALYGPEGNGNYRNLPLSWLLEWLLAIVKWGAPVLLILGGAGLLLRVRRPVLPA